MPNSPDNQHDILLYSSSVIQKELHASLFQLVKQGTLGGKLSI